MTAISSSVLALTGTAAHVLSALYLVTLMFAMGLDLGGVHEDKATKRRKRRRLVRALLFNLLALPAIAIAVTRLLQPSEGVQVALLLLAATPGGRFAPQLAAMARADRVLSVEISLFLFKLAPLTAPFAVAWMLGARRVDMHELTFIAELFLLQMAPFLAGKLLRRRRPAIADRVSRPAHVASFALLVAIIAFVVAHRDLGMLWHLQPRDWLSVLLCAALSLALGWLAGGRTPSVRRSFALSADARNLGLALVIATLAFPSGKTDLDLFGVWAVLLAFNCAFALFSRRERATRSSPYWRPREA